MKRRDPTLAQTELHIAAANGRAMVPFLRRFLSRAIPLVPGCVLADVSVALVGDTRMAQLHEQFLGIPGPTDVLTFELDHDARNRVTSGEIVVCVPEARRRAKDLGHKIENEVLLYALHGVLHLSGYDDRTDSEYRRMHRTEDRILTQLGVGRVFTTPKSKRGPLRRHKPARK